MIKMVDTTEMYSGTNCEYLKNVPNWHVEDSPWKAEKAYCLLDKHSIKPNTVAEIGCGAGEILNQLRNKLPETVEFTGYDISQDAINMAKLREKERLHYFCQNLLEEDVNFDLLLLMDVFEHVEDYRQFLKIAKTKATYKIFSIPLEINGRTIINPNAIGRQYDEVGHLHFFTPYTAQLALRSCGYEILDWMYVSKLLECSSNASGFKKWRRHAKTAIFKGMKGIFGTKRMVDVFGLHSVFALTR